MRASFAMEPYAIDHDLLALQRAMGHSSITTTNIVTLKRQKRSWRCEEIIRLRQGNNGGAVMVRRTGHISQLIDGSRTVKK